MMGLALALALELEIEELDAEEASRLAEVAGTANGGVDVSVADGAEAFSAGRPSYCGGYRTGVGVREGASSSFVGRVVATAGAALAPRVGRKERYRTARAMEAHRI